MSRSDARELAEELAERRREVATAAAVSRAGVARAELLAGATAAGQTPRLPDPPARPRTDWRQAVRFAVEQRMYTPDYLRFYARYVFHRLRHPHVELQGMVFFGRRVELFAPEGYGRLSLGPWCWVGDGNRLRAHEGNVRLGPKVVMGQDNVINGHLDVEVGRNALLGDWIYICDFDHNIAELDLPIKKQGITKTPVRIGEDVWIGEKASILRGSDIGAGSVVASQALVKGHIPPFSIVVGSPARVVRSRLPSGMTAEEALDLQRRGRAIPEDPLDGS